MFQGIREKAVRDIEDFCELHGLTAWQFGMKFAHDHKFLDSLKRGGPGGSIGLTRLEQVAHRAAEWAAGRPIPVGGVRGFGGVYTTKLAA